MRLTSLPVIVAFVPWHPLLFGRGARFSIGVGATLLVESPALGARALIEFWPRQRLHFSQAPSHAQSPALQLTFIQLEGHRNAFGILTRGKKY